MYCSPELRQSEGRTDTMQIQIRVHIRPREGLDRVKSQE